MAILTVLVLLAMIGAGYWYARRARGKPPASRTVAALPAAVPAVSRGVGEVPRRPGRMVNPGKVCCAAARRIESAWYPENAAPPLPLGNCEHPQTCNCTWTRVLDRRITHRRVQHDRREQMRFEDKSDRRAGADRRSDAANPWKNN